jgi:hypothetical protein
MKKNSLTRRRFIVSASAGTAGAMLTSHLPVFGNSGTGLTTALALEGGKPVRTREWVRWPIWNADAEAPILSMLRSGNWWRGSGNLCSEFEEK